MLEKEKVIDLGVSFKKILEICFVNNNIFLDKITFTKLLNLWSMNMKSTIEKLKNLKNVTEEQVNSVIHEQTYKAVLKELEEDGINIDDLTEEEFNQLLAEEIKKQKSFAKGMMIGGSALLLLELLG